MRSVGLGSFAWYLSALMDMDGSFDQSRIGFARAAMEPNRDAWQPGARSRTARLLASIHSRPAWSGLYAAGLRSLVLAAAPRSLPAICPPCPPPAVPPGARLTTKRLTSSTASDDSAALRPPHPAQPQRPLPGTAPQKPRALPSRAKHAGPISLRLRQGAHPRLGPRAAGSQDQHQI
jgi:hypothetical protein